MSLTERNGIRIRWITTCCFEVVLPNGKVIVFDPWTGNVPEGEPQQLAVKTGFSKDDFTGADYIFLSHTHGDHVWDAKYILEKFRKDTYGGQVFAPALSSKIICDYLDIPYRDMVPMFPGETLDLEDIIVTCHKCRHFGDIGSPRGTTPSIAKKKCEERHSNPEIMNYNNMGSLEEIDLSITVKANNFRFMILGGRIYRFNNVIDYAQTFNPNFIVRQVSPGFTPDDYAGIIAQFHAPVVFPSHHDSHHVDKAQGISFEEYFDRTNAKLKELGSCARVVNPVSGKWYFIGTGIEEV